MMVKNSKKRYADEYFNGMKPKELSQIEYETPLGHKVKAMICRKPNRYLGSLLILEVDGEQVEQFVQGMPKIHYLDNYHMIGTGTDYGFISAYEKLDGTNVCLYGLKDKDGELLEIVPKTRNMGTLDKDFLDMYRECDTKAFENEIRENPDHILYLELYGMGNIHMVKHLDTWLDVKLLGMYDGERFVKDNDFFLSYHRRPHTLFNIHNISGSGTGYTYYVNNAGLAIRYSGYVGKGGESCRDMNDCIAYIQKSLDELNRAYLEENHRLALEGVVINGINSDGELTYIKVKPTDIELAHKSEKGIPRQYIMKEIMKYLDENRSMAKETWENNPEEVMEYLNRNLLESFEQPYIDKSQNKIKRLFEEKITPAPTPEDIMMIGDTLLRDYPDKGITDLMRIFGQNNPDMKKSGGKLYRYLEERMG